jgi:hypothetical protein
MGFTMKKIFVLLFVLLMFANILTANSIHSNANVAVKGAVKIASGVVLTVAAVLASFKLIEISALAHTGLLDKRSIFNLIHIHPLFVLIPGLAVGTTLLKIGCNDLKNFFDALQ